MSERTLIAAAGGVVALSLLLFLAPLLGIIVVAVIAIGVPALLFLDRRPFTRLHRLGPGASGPGTRGYRGDVTVGEDGAADYEVTRRAS